MMTKLNRKIKLFSNFRLYALLLFCSSVFTPTSFAYSEAASLAWYEAGARLLETSATVLAQKSYAFKAASVQFVQKNAISPLDHVGIIAAEQRLFSAGLSEKVNLSVLMNTQSAGGKLELKLAL